VFPSILFALEAALAALVQHAEHPAFEPIGGDRGGELQRPGFPRHRVGLDESLHGRVELLVVIEELALEGEDLPREPEAIALKRLKLAGRLGERREARAEPFEGLRGLRVSDDLRPPLRPAGERRRYS